MKAGIKEEVTPFRFKVLNFSARLFRVDLFADFETRKLVI